MDLLLIRDVEGLGRRGDRVSVRRGYARNHLLPLGFAVRATPDNVRRVEKRRVAWLAEEAKMLEELRELAGHLEALDLTVVEKASETGHLYGSVTEKGIAEAATSAGVPLEPKAVRLESPIKEVGDYRVPVRLHPEVQLEVSVKVRAEGREDWVPGREVEATPAGPGTAGEAAEPGAPDTP